MLNLGQQRHGVVNIGKGGDNATQIHSNPKSTRPNGQSDQNPGYRAQ
jgi:hypothetical protein